MTATVRLELDVRVGRGPCPEQLAWLVELRDGGATLDDIADALRISRRSVARWSKLAARDVVFVDRFPIEPAIAVAGSAEILAAHVGVDVGTVHQWKQRRVGWRRADRIAVALGRHPGAIWPEWWAAA